jgi:serine/threonine protein kinase/predicted ATPase
VDSLGRYKLVKKIGAGGMAEVYLARAYGAQGIEKQLVLKRVLPAYIRDAHFITMFVDEAQVASRLNHSNIVQIYAFEQIGRDYVLAMEYLDGADLTKLMVAARREGRMIPPELAAYIIHEVARGLDYAHNRRDDHGEPLEIVHRDVSPQNILLSYGGEVKIADFGIARARQFGDEASGIIKGKFAYMSPEQASGADVDRRSDIFSLGVVMFELLAGRALYRGKPGSELLKAVRAAVIPPIAEVSKRGVPQELEAIVRRSLAREPGDRYQSARDMAADIARYLHGLDDLVDATTLEAYLHRVLPKSETATPPLTPAPEKTTAPTEGVLPTVAFQKGRRPKQTREKLNVVAVAGRLRGAKTLGSAIGERRAAARVREFLRIVEEISFKNDGVVARQDEKGFLIFLGLPLSGVDDPVRAVRLALDVIDAAEGLSYDLPSALHLGLGINRGPARVEREEEGRVADYEPYGLLSPLAERLADDSGPGEIRVGGGVYRLSRRDFNFEELPSISLPLPAGTGGEHPETTDGGEADVQETGAEGRKARVYRLLGAKTPHERRLDARTEGPLLGRDAELADLTTIYKEATTAAKPAFVWIAGDMGIGKTRLVNEFLARADVGAHRRVVRADCTLSTRDVSFGAIADLVRDACGIGEDDRSQAMRTKLEVTFARLRGPDERSKPGDTGEAAAMHERVLTAFALLLGVALPSSAASTGDGLDRKDLIRTGLLRLVGGLAQSEPLVLIVENVHFADTPSLELLAWLAAQPLERPMVTLLLGRPEERLNRLFTQLRRVVLHQLVEDDRLRLVLERLGESDEARDLARQICARTGGNPFFISEVIEALIDRGVVRFDGKDRKLHVDRRGSIRIPTTLEGAIAARIDELPPDERLLLRWASVVGLTFTEATLAELAGGDVKAPLDRLVKRRILVVRDRPATDAGEGEAAEGAVEPSARHIAFRYPVMREVAYDGLVGPDRLQMHKRMANMLISKAGDKPGPLSARIAFHLERANDLGTAAQRYLEAAELARAAYTNREALRYYARAISLLPPEGEERFRAHESREQILRGLGRRREQMAELDQMRHLAQSLNQPSLVALAYNRLARLYLDLGRLPHASKALAVALEAARSGADVGAEVEALRLLSVLARNEGQHLRALECCDQALTLLGCSTAALKQRGTILLSRGDALRQMGRLQEAVQPYAEALVIYRRLDIKRLQARTLNAMGQVARALGEYEDALGLLRRSLKLDHQINDRFRVGRKLCDLGMTYAELGDMEKALNHLRQAAQANQQLGDRAGMEETLVGLADVLLAAGATKEAEGTLAEAHKLAADSGSRFTTLRCDLVKADLAAAAGDHEAAAAAAEDALKLAQAGSLPAGELQAQVRLALARASRHETAPARQALDRARALIAEAGEVERADVVQLRIGQAFELLGLAGEASRAFAGAAAEVERRLGRLHSPERRRTYQALPHVAEIQKRAAANAAPASPESPAPAGRDHAG